MATKKKSKVLKKKGEDKWMAEAFGQNKGALHRALGVPEDEPIPLGTMEKAAKKRGKLGARARAGVTGAKIARRGKKR
jgi:hypothetical protein